MIDTDEQYFQESGIKFHGIAAMDIMTYKMTKHFNDAAEFMHEALTSGGNFKLFIIIYYYYYYYYFICKLAPSDCLISGMQYY